jgi:hypothetical protein
MPIPRIANFHLVTIMFRVEILFSYAYASLKAKILDREISDHLQSSQQCDHSIVVCNLQIKNKLETYYVNRGKPEGRF